MAVKAFYIFGKTTVKQKKTCLRIEKLRTRMIPVNNDDNTVGLLNIVSYSKNVWAVYVKNTIPFGGAQFK